MAPVRVSLAYPSYHGELTFPQFLSKLSEPFTRETKSWLAKKVDSASPDHPFPMAMVEFPS